MQSVPASIALLQQQFSAGETTPLDVLNVALAHSNSNAGHNVYLSQDAGWSRAQASALRVDRRVDQPLWGLPVSLKDCFDLAGFATTCGSVYYQREHGIASTDSALVRRLKAAGAVITGKTHMHQLAYGITGENKDFGDCVQPRNPAWLTGGSSSGAAASVQEGSCIAAIGTDTGGSVRVPAALCGLAGYRSSVDLQGGLWEGGAHLAAAFDTIGWLYRDPADGPLLGRALFDLPLAEAPAIRGLRVGVPERSFFHDCDADVVATLAAGEALLAREGAVLGSFDASYWDEAYAIFAVVQACEAAALHRGRFEHFEPVIAERLAWGENMPAAEHSRRLVQWDDFRDRTRALFQHFDYLLLPCCPMSALIAGEDQTQARGRILRYTTPISLAGLPVAALPGAAGGLQLVGPAMGDAALLALSAAIGSAEKR